MSPIEKHKANQSKERYLKATLSERVIARANERAVTDGFARALVSEGLVAVYDTYYKSENRARNRWLTRVALVSASILFL